MNKIERELWDNLMSLIETSDAFFFKDESINGDNYRMFNYRLASYTQFMLPSGIESRGIMFEIDSNGEPLRIAARPMEKFWNLNENPSTMDLDLSEVVDIEIKADGSLISSYLTSDGNLALKTKGSLSSDQAIAATEWIKKNQQFYDEVLALTDHGYTVNMEWCSPLNRIVLDYDSSSLHVLNVRHCVDGDYLDYNEVCNLGYHTLIQAWTERVTIGDDMVVDDFINSVPQMTNIEGYVVRLASGQRIKIKTEWYKTLHHNKDSVNNPRRLYESVLDEVTDDLKTMFYDNATVIKQITDMETFVANRYNNFVSSVESFYEQNKNLSRKDYAIKGQQELTDKLQFSAVMMLYTGKPVSYKDMMKKKWRDYGIDDVVGDAE